MKSSNNAYVKKVTCKKTVRRYTPITSMRHFIEKIRVNGDKKLFMWYDSVRILHSISYNEFADLVKKEAAAFSKLGFTDKRIAIIGETSYEWVATYVAAIASGQGAQG